MITYGDLKSVIACVGQRLVGDPNVTTVQSIRYEASEPAATDEIAHGALTREDRDGV